MNEPPVLGKKSLKWTKEGEVLFNWDGYDMATAVGNVAPDGSVPTDKLFEHVYYYINNDDGLNDAVWESMERAVREYYEDNPS